MLQAETVALVTGANRGLGRAFVDVLLKRGVDRVYCAIRDMRTQESLPVDDRVVPILIDLEDPESIYTAAERTSDVTLLINNAAFASFASPLGGAVADVEREMRVNYFGTYRMIEAFTSLLSLNAGTVINVLSKLALTNAHSAAGYAASKVAMHFMSESLQPVMAAKGVELFVAYPGGIDTEMLAHFSGPKTSPLVVAENILTAASKGHLHIFPDPESQDYAKATNRL